MSIPHAHKIKARPAVGLARWMVQRRRWALPTLRVLSVFLLLLCGLGIMQHSGWAPAVACMLGVAVWAFTRRARVAVLAAIVTGMTLVVLKAVVGGAANALATTWSVVTSPAGLVAVMLVVAALFMGGGKGAGKAGLP